MEQRLHDILQAFVDDGSVPGAVGLVARGDRVEVAAAGTLGVGDPTPMTRDSLFRIASITKPVVAAAVMMLVDDGRIALSDPVAAWLPELAEPMVVRTPAGPLDDVVPAAAPITVLDLPASRAGYGFPADFSLPALAPLFGELKQGPPRPQQVMAPDAWMATLAAIPCCTSRARPGSTTPAPTSRASWSHGCRAARSTSSWLSGSSSRSA